MANEERGAPGPQRGTHNTAALRDPGESLMHHTGQEGEWLSVLTPWTPSLRASTSYKANPRGQLKGRGRTTLRLGTEALLGIRASRGDLGLRQGSSWGGRTRLAAQASDQTREELVLGSFLKVTVRGPQACNTQQVS